ncbi:olfactory receptor 1f45-like [Ambystoma mexicanum]|uniref:olfactory receptor 1f45-like n=1 Tax=Ambystoma mexicanum TaxID=8296 RepID=UPI0037E850E7
MEKGNHSGVSEFILLGFAEPPEHRITLFVCFFTMYFITLAANLTIIFIIRVDARLHTPMYFFLSILSFMDICLTTTTVPKLLANIFSKRKTISYNGCFLQLHFFISFGIMTDFLLAIMAVDRYVAISKPLHYTMLMNKGFCVKLVAGSWLIVSLHSAANIILAARLSFCGSNEIHHYFCDLPPLFKLSCSDTSIHEMLLLTETSFFMLSPLACIIISYILIIFTIWGMPSKKGKVKAFSTCSSHLSVVALAYGPLLYTHIRPNSPYFVEKDLIISVLYSIGSSMLNPFVYSIRNKDVKMALITAFNRNLLSWSK